MAREVPVQIQTFVAGEDLSAKQYYLVKLSAGNTVVVCTAVTDKPVGILQNNPGSGGAAEVMLLGISKISSDAALAAGAAYGTSADGQGVTKTIGTDITHFVMGQVIDASGAAGGIATVTVNGLNPARAA